MEKKRKKTKGALWCPICQGGRFGTYRGRENSRCRKCGAKERERLMALVVKRSKLKPLGLPVYHFAPELGISQLLFDRFGELYQPADIEPELYPKLSVPVKRIDLCRPLEHIPAGSAGGLVHSHVLEHIPASLERVIRDLNRTLAPGGFHLFQVPIHEGWSREDMDPDLDPAVREERFYQFDHMRVFGTMDFAARVLPLFEGFDRVDLKKFLRPGHLKRAVIPGTALDLLTGHTVFLFVKRGRDPFLKRLANGLASAFSTKPGTFES